MPTRVPLRSVLGHRVLVADGGMGTMLQGFALSAADFLGYEGCNELLNVTRPEVIAAVHRAYFDAGADLVTTNTFGANLTALADYGLGDRLEELAEAGARIARQVADERGRWVLGSLGPGTKLATLGQVGFGESRDAYARQTAALLRGGVDAVIIETCQDLLGIRAAVAGAKRAIAAAAADCPILVSVTVETNGTLLVGSDLTAVVATLVPLGIDALGLNCATGPEDMRPHLRELARLCPLPLSCMPNAGLPVLTADGAAYPLGADEFGRIMGEFVGRYGIGVAGGCCGTTPEHIRALVRVIPEPRGCSRPASEGTRPTYPQAPTLTGRGLPAVGHPPSGRSRSRAFGPGLGECEGVGPGVVGDGSRGAEQGDRASVSSLDKGIQWINVPGVDSPVAAVSGRQGQRAVVADEGALRTTPAGVGGAVASLYSATSLTQDVAYLAIGERANVSGSRAFRDALLADDWDACVEIARAQVAEGAHILDLCVDYVGRDGCRDMAELAARIAREVDVPLQVDSSDPAVLRAGLEVIPGRAVVNSVSLEGGAGPGSKLARTLDIVREHGAVVVGLCIDETGQARTTTAKVAVARRLISVLTSEYCLDPGDIIIDPLTYPIGTGQADARADAAATIEAMRQLHAEYPHLHLMAGVSNVSFGLAPAARVVLNSVYLDECRRAGLDCAIIPAGRIRPLAAVPEAQVQAALDLVWNRSDDALERFLGLFEGVAADPVATDIETLPVAERLRRHILHGAVAGLEADLTEALAATPALTIINETLLEAMREVGERFGAGTMQLPFVLKSAEVMKRAVTVLGPHLSRVGGAGKGTLVLATVRGDVHDIGKNLVDIILTNNGYRVVNLGIKQPITDIIAAAEAEGADAIGLSGLLVKSTQVMAENLEELNARGLAARYPVLLGGAALTRSYVEHELTSLYAGEVRYARDAFEGLRLMDAVMAAKAGAGELPAPPPRRVTRTAVHEASDERAALRRPVPGGVDVPVPPFWGVREARAGLADIQPWLDKRALFAGQWGLKAAPNGPTADELAHTVGEPALAHWLARAGEWLDLRVVWGFWPCHSEGNDLVVMSSNSLAVMGASRPVPVVPPTPLRFTFPRQTGGEHLCLADFFRDQGEAAEWGPDVVAFQLVTIGDGASRATAELFGRDAYRDYF
ncbi:MAG: homocysteine S-methyltransferase family protein, partial [Propionibacteriaceae bacterium]|nr:homocysteine S-methyltransferase family protein [Propionibacteriaceae bacterium]